MPRRTGNFVFVYGTLKQGFHNHGLLAREDFLGFGTTDSLYKMIAGSFPVIFKDQDGVQVDGELYEVSDECLANLDRLEGEGVMYHRLKDRVTAVDPLTQTVTIADAFIYVGDKEYWKNSSYALYESRNEFGMLEWVA